jgi:hypothetical protein
MGSLTVMIPAPPVLANSFDNAHAIRQCIVDSDFKRNEGIWIQISSEMKAFGSRFLLRNEGIWIQISSEMKAFGSRFLAK